MKKLLVMFLCCSMFLASCGAAPATSSIPSSSATSGTSSNVSDTSSSPDSASKEESQAESSGGSIDVDKGLFDVEITLPASMFEGTNQEDIESKAKEGGISEVKFNDDGSVTYRMSKAVHKKMMDEIRTELVKSLDEIANGEDFPSIKEIKGNDDFSKITLSVDKAAYENSLDAFAILQCAMSGMMYQTFLGVEPSLTVEVADEATGEVITIESYPKETEE